MTGAAFAADAGLSIEDGIATTRLMADAAGSNVFVSPDGRQYAVMLVTGDLERDGVWVDLRVGSLSSIRAAHPRSVARLFASGLGGGYAKRFGSDGLMAQGDNPLIWIDGQTLAFLWEDAKGVRQVFGVDVQRRRTYALTNHPTPVFRFLSGPDGSLFYTAAIARDFSVVERRQLSGYTVQDTDAIQLLNGGIRGPWDWMMHEQFLLDVRTRRRRVIQFGGGDVMGRYLPLAESVYSADGRHLVAARSVSGPDIPPQWGMYTQEHFRSMWKSRSNNPESIYARQLQKLFVVDVASARARVLWDVPVDAMGRTRIAWSADGRQVAVAPTALPVATDDADARAGRAAAVVDTETGAFERLPLAGSAAETVHSLVWSGAQQIDAHLLDGTVVRWQRGPTNWMSVPTATDEEARSPTQPVTISIRQSLNTPPTLWATDRRTGEAREILDPNPQLQRMKLGRVEWLSEARPDGTVWEGRLYFPRNYQPGHRYPLVVQTYAFTPRDQFSLYGHKGPSLGPGRSAYIAQALASRDVFVLHGPSRAESVEAVSSMLDELESQIEKLVANGLVDRGRVGIMGFSASGWFTTFALTRGRFPYAAALTDDNKDGSYFQAGLSNWDFGAGEQMIGAPPFGEGLKRWLEYSPAMNPERIHTPLLMTRSSAGLPLNGWELFSRLRYLHKPVEYYFIPDVEHGSHGLQNPRQLRALQGRALDWWCFWLKGERDPDTAKQSQYAQWEKLRELHLRDVGSDASLPGVLL
ncbi:MAG TPA: prolyl oligopeptidase family serine peptidase [Povalibacter sp.]